MAVDLDRDRARRSSHAWNVLADASDDVAVMIIMIVVLMASPTALATGNYLLRARLPRRLRSRVGKQSR